MMVLDVGGKFHIPIFLYIMPENRKDDERDAIVVFFNFLTGYYYGIM